MPRNSFFEKQTWYEVQRLYNNSPESYGEWLMWSQHNYDYTSSVDSRKSQIRLKARSNAIKEAKNSISQGWQVRIIHCELIA